MDRFDAIVVGAGHNGLVAAVRLLRSGLRVCCLEDKDVVGGACRTEQPFRKAPSQKASTGAYLLGVMAPEIIDNLDLRAEIYPLLERRMPHYFLPTTGKHYLLFGEPSTTRESITNFFSAADARAYDALADEIGKIRDDVAPSFLLPPEPVEEIARRYLRPELQQIFVDLCQGSVFSYLRRFDFKDDLLVAMLAVTDGLSGLCASVHTPGTGFNFLMHNMCRLPNSDGTWMRVRGGMGAITQVLADAVRKRGGTIVTSAKVREITVRDGRVSGVKLDDGRSFEAPVVLVNADPARLLSIAPKELLTGSYVSRIRDALEPGSTMKINLCLTAPPSFSCLQRDLGQFEGTTHIIPDAVRPLQLLEKNYRRASLGELPMEPAIEWYFDRRLGDGSGRFSSALFVPCLPADITGSSWDRERDDYATHLLEVCERFAPGLRKLVYDRDVLAPPDIERRFGITGGQIHHIPNTRSFIDRIPYRTPIPGLYSAGSGGHPGGAVTGAPGYICAGAVLRDLARDE